MIRVFVFMDLIIGLKTKVVKLEGEILLGLGFWLGCLEKKEEKADFEGMILGMAVESIAEKLSDDRPPVLFCLFRSPKFLNNLLIRFLSIRLRGRTEGGSYDPPTLESEAPTEEPLTAPPPEEPKKTETTTTTTTNVVSEEQAAPESESPVAVKVEVPEAVVEEAKTTVTPEEPVVVEKTEVVAPEPPVEDSTTAELEPEAAAEPEAEPEVPKEEVAINEEENKASVEADEKVGTEEAAAAPTEG